MMRLIPDLKLETDLEEESAEVDTTALNTGEPKQYEGFIHETEKDLLMREDLIRTEVVNINCSKYIK